MYYGLRKEGIPSAKDGTLPWRDSIFFEKVNKESPMPKPGRKVRALKRINVRAGPPISMQGSTSEWPQSKGLLAPNDEVKIDNVKQYPVSGGVYYWIYFSR